MCEAFGLDRKIEKYKGVRPISFYRWDLDCILDVLDMTLNDEKEYPDKNNEGYIILHELYLDLKKAYKETYENGPLRSSIPEIVPPLEIFKEEDKN